MKRDRDRETGRQTKLEKKRHRNIEIEKNRYI